MSRWTFRPISGVTLRVIEVLLVEPDAASEVTLTKFLEANGCRVRAATTLADARMAVRRHAPEVVVSDLARGVGSAGWSLAEQMRREPTTRHVCHLALTSQAEERLELVRVFDAFLPKPLDQALLLDLVGQLASIARGLRRRMAL